MDPTICTELLQLIYDHSQSSEPSAYNLNEHDHSLIVNEDITNLQNNGEKEISNDENPNLDAHFFLHGKICKATNFYEARTFNDVYKLLEFIINIALRDTCEIK